MVTGRNQVDDGNNNVIKPTYNLLVQSLTDAAHQA